MKIEQGKLNDQTNTLADLAKVRRAGQGGAAPGARGGWSGLQGRMRNVNCSVMSDSSVTPWTIACQAPLSMGFSRQKYQSGLPFLSTGDLPNSGIQPGSPALQEDSLPSEPPGKPVYRISLYILDMKLLSDIHIANSFCQFSSCLFTLIMVSFDE